MALSERLLTVAPDGPALDVLVVGSGPVGLFAAAELANKGCKVRIIDVNEAPVIMTKASGVAERSMEILPQPVVDSILRTSKHVRQARMLEHDGSGNATTIATIGMLTEMRGGRGLRSQMQWLTEKALTEFLTTLPDQSRPGRQMQVDRPYQLTGFKEVETGVECQVKDVKTGNIERVDAKFLLGCDGGRSFVRKSLGFTFEGEATPEYFFAIHATFTGYNGNDGSVDMFFSKGDDPMAPGFVFAMPMPDGGYLVIVDLDANQQREWVTGELDRNGWPILRQPGVEDVVRVMRNRGLGLELAMVPDTLEWLSHFRVNSRMTSCYGKGRVYLAGDALHCHSPLGGQGMNMGFNDAKNIAFKLAWAAKGVVPLSFLDSYEKERQPIEHKILHALETAQKGVSSRNPVVFFMRGRGQRVAPVLLNFALEHTDGQILQYGTQQAWSYKTSPLSVEHWERPGASFPIPCQGLYHRKNQNVYRWIGTRIRAGDTVPDAPVFDKSIHKVMKRSKGWTLLLFQGSEADNEVQSKYQSVEILSMGELYSLGQSLKTPEDRTGFAPGIHEVLVAPADGEAQKAFGVRGQCLFLIRPDFHVSLRSEPVRKDAVLQYFDKQCGMTVGPYTAVAGAGSFDPLPVAVYAFIFAASLGYSLYKGFDYDWVGGICVVSAVILCFLVRASRPPR